MFKKSFLKNWFVWAIVLFVVAFIIALILTLIFEYFKWQIGIGAAASSGAAVIVGGIYSKIFKEVMPKNLRLKIALFDAAISLIIITVVSYKVGMLSPESVKDPIFYIFLSSVILGGVVGSLMLYWLLWLGGKAYITEKKQKKKLV